MLLKLEVVGAQASGLGEQRSKIFATEGGTIGRIAGNDWVLPDQFVSGRHAAIQYANGQFYVIDTNSSNGVFLNNPNFRLERGRPYPLNSGDRLLIDPFDIHVSVIESPAMQQAEAAHERSKAPGPRSVPGPASVPAAASGRVAVEEQVLFAMSPRGSGGTGPAESLVPTCGDQAQQPVDPLVALGLGVPGRPVGHEAPPRASVEPPRVFPAQPPAAPRRAAPAARPDVRRPAAQPSPPPSEASAQRSTPRAPPPWRPVPAAPAPPEAKSPALAPGLRAAPAVPAQASRAVPSAAGEDRAQLDFAALLSAAGLHGVPVTPELAASFGSILKVVVEGLGDVLRAREELKDQFRLRITGFAPRENNPLKFSANTEDALHNLLVRRHPAYLEPVAAFTGAFDDLRIHQMAMLAGLRAGYEAMVAAFDPATLERKFERYARRGGLLGGTRYWDLYRELFAEMTADPDECFRTLFGSAFSKAYEEQTRLLKQHSPEP